MQVKVGKQYRITPNISAGIYNTTVTVVHIFRAGVKPDETLMRVYAAGPAGEPPPENVYNSISKDRWVMKKDDGRFMITVMPMVFHKVEEVEELEHGNT